MDVASLLLPQGHQFYPCILTYLDAASFHLEIWSYLRIPSYLDAASFESVVLLLHKFRLDSPVHSSILGCCQLSSSHGSLVLFLHS